MRPEDLGIKGFEPSKVEPRPKPAATSDLARAAHDVDVKVRALIAGAESVGRENVTLRSGYERALSTIQRLTAELFHTRRALEEAQRHRALLFWIGLALALFFVLK